MDYPLIGLAVSFSLGIIVGTYFRIPFFALCSIAITFLLFALASVKQSKKFSIYILLAVFILGALVLKNSQILANHHIARLIPYKAESVSVVGVIDSDPIYQERTTSFILRAEKVGLRDFWQKASGRILVRVSRKEAFSYGDRLFLRGNLYQPFSSPEGFNYKDYLRHQNVYLILSISKTNGSIKKIEQNCANPLVSFSLKIKHRLREVLVKNLSAFSAGILNALILGDRQDLSRYLLDIFMNLGTIHIIAISGFNVGIVALIILSILKIIKIPRRTRSILTILLLMIYCILTGMSPPVVRATLMGAIFLCAYFFKREVNIYNSLSIAVLIILAVNPWQLFEISFQLSFLSVFFIVWLAPKIKSLFPEKWDKIPWLRFLTLTFSVSTAAWIGLAPLIAYYFKTFTTLTVLANMIIVPYSAIITTTGFSLALIGIFIPSLAPVFAATNELLILILFKIHYLLINIPGAYFKLPEISMGNVLLYYFLLIAVVNFQKIFKSNFLLTLRKTMLN